MFVGDMLSCLSQFHDGPSELITAAARSLPVTAARRTFLRDETNIEVDMVPAGFKLGCIGVFLFPFIVFATYVAVTVTPRARATERLAATRFIQVRVVDADSHQPIEGAVVLVDANYRQYRTGIMGYSTPGHRAYRLRTNDAGIAKIPLKYFLIRGLQFDRVLLWFSNMRAADLPHRYLIAALHDDYSMDQVKINKVGNDFPFTDPTLLPELKLIQRAKLSLKQGSLYNTDVRFINKFNANRLRFYYYLDGVEQQIARCASVEQADFVIAYKAIHAGDGAFTNRLPTDDARLEKVLWSIEALGNAGVAIDPEARFQFEYLRETTELKFEKQIRFENRLGREPEFEVLIVHSRDGQHTAALEVRPKSIQWLWANPEAKFRHARVHAGDASKYCIDHGLTRDFDPNQKPDHRHWKKAPKPKNVNHPFRLKFVPFKGFVPVAQD